VLVAPIVAWFADIATILFLAWLLAFLIRPLALGLARLVTRASYGTAVALAYAIVGVGAAIVLAVVGISVAQSIADFTAGGTSVAADLEARLAPLQAQLDAAGLGSVRLAAAIESAVGAVDLGSAQAIDTVGGIVATLAGALGTLSIIVFLSVYMAADRDHLSATSRALVPARYRGRVDMAYDEIGHAFGGFVRGQVVMGVMYGVVAFFAAIALGLPYAPLIGITVAVLQTIPYFGPYVSWAPPVVVALIAAPDAVLPAVVIMAVAQVVLANFIQPRIIGNAVGLSPFAVLVAVLIGSKVAGVLGAIFSVPVAAAAVAIMHRMATASADAAPAAAMEAKEPEHGRATTATALAHDSADTASG
jgi:predicted PurR-regulated permease PerM